MPRKLGHTVAQELLTETLRAWNNVSVAHSHATHGYIFLSNSKYRWIRDHGYAYGNPNILKYVCTEYSGALSDFIVLHILVV